MYLDLHIKYILFFADFNEISNTSTGF
jgi:hypothetical protein